MCRYFSKHSFTSLRTSLTLVEWRPDAHGDCFSWKRFPSWCMRSTTRNYLYVPRQWPFGVLGILHRYVPVFRFLTPSCLLCTSHLSGAESLTIRPSDMCIIHPKPLIRTLRFPPPPQPTQRIYITCTPSYSRWIQSICTNWQEARHGRICSCPYRGELQIVISIVRTVIFNVSEPVSAVSL